jgi:hypothetical protein
LNYVNFWGIGVWGLGPIPNPQNCLEEVCNYIRETENQTKKKITNN